MISWTGPVLMIGCYTALLGNALAGAAGTSALKILDLAGVEIDQPRPWTAAP
jgi:hypothetical protein